MEPTHELDVLGHYCPVPVSKTRKSLEKLSAGDVLKVISDDPETLHDMPILIERLGHVMVQVTKNSGEYYFVIEVKD